MGIIVVNLQDNRAVFRIFIALLRFSFDPPSYLQNKVSKKINQLSQTIIQVMLICPPEVVVYKILFRATSQADSLRPFIA